MQVGAVPLSALLPLRRWSRGGRGRTLFCPRVARALVGRGRRLDHHDLLHASPFDQPAFRSRKDLLLLCRAYFDNRRCEQYNVGALWSYPGALDTHWHCDGKERPGLHVLTAMHDLPADAGFLHFQPFTQADARFDASDCEQPPETHEPPPVPVVLRKGESVAWLYSTKHAAVPNPTDVERVLLYTVYGVEGFRDTSNHEDGLPSVLENSDGQRFPYP